MGVLSLLSRRFWIHRTRLHCLYSSAYIGNKNGSNYLNYFPFSYWHQSHCPNLCLLGNNNGLNGVHRLNLMDCLSSGMWNISGQQLMQRWNRHLKQHGIRVKLSKRLKFAGNRVMMWCKVRRRTRHPRGIQIPKKRHKQ